MRRAGARGRDPRRPARRRRALSPDGAWLALRAVQDGKGSTSSTPSSCGAADQVVFIGESTPDPFAERLLWSPDGRFLVADARRLRDRGTPTSPLRARRRQRGAPHRHRHRLRRELAERHHPLDEPRRRPSRARIRSTSRAGCRLGTASSARPATRLTPSCRSSAPTAQTVIFWGGPLERGRRRLGVHSGGGSASLCELLDGTSLSVNAPLFADAPVAMARRSVAWAPPTRMPCRWQRDTSRAARSRTYSATARGTAGELSLTSARRGGLPEAPPCATWPSPRTAATWRSRAAPDARRPGPAGRRARLVTRNFGERPTRWRLSGRPRSGWDPASTRPSRGRRRFHPGEVWAGVADGRWLSERSAGEQRPGDGPRRTSTVDQPGDESERAAPAHRYTRRTTFNAVR